MVVGIIAIFIYLFIPGPVLNHCVSYCHNIGTADILLLWIGKNKFTQL